MQREDKHVSMARSMEDSNVLIKYKGTTTMDETAESFPPPKGVTGAPKHTSNDLEGVRVAPDSIPTSYRGWRTPSSGGSTESGIACMDQ